jgi:hypothetical protein
MPDIFFSTPYMCLEIIYIYIKWNINTSELIKITTALIVQQEG